jgi:hypothetical protein
MKNPELKHTDKFGNHKYDPTKAGSPMRKQMYPSTGRQYEDSFSFSPQILSCTFQNISHEASHTHKFCKLHFDWSPHLINSPFWPVELIT